MTEVIIREERQRQHVIDLISKLSPKHPWRVEIKRYVKRRTLSANALYWAWLQIIANATDNSAEDCHEAFKDMFLPRVVIDMGGDLVKVHPSTTKLTTIDFSEYMTKVEAYAVSELGLSLPHPEDMQMRPLNGRVSMSDVSADLDTPETYENRRGA